MSLFTDLVALSQKHAKTSHASTIIAQGMLESGLSPNSEKVSGLASKYNNYFGMKAPDGYTGKVTPNLETEEDNGSGNKFTIKAGFKWYDNMEESVMDRERLIAVSPSAYVPVRNATTPEDEAKALQGVYATDSEYAKKLIDLINVYNLKQYDKDKNLGDDTVTVTAEAVLNVARKYIGVTKGSSAHKALVDRYNKVSPRPVGYAVKYSDDWCDTFVTAVADEAKATSLIGRECGVERHKTIFKNKNIWLGLVTPKAGDIVIWRWDGNRSGYAHHIGFVEKVSGNTITTIEGNTTKNGVSCVGRNTYAWNASTIQGYARPKYSVVTGGSTPVANNPDEKKVSQHFVVTTNSLRAFDKASSKGKIVENITKDYVKNIDVTVEAEGYVWGGWISSADGKRRWTTLQTADGKRKFVDVKSGTIGHGGKTYTEWLDTQKVSTPKPEQPVGGDEPKIQDGEFTINGVVYTITKK